MRLKDIRICWVSMADPTYFEGIAVNGVQTNLFIWTLEAKFSIITLSREMCLHQHLKDLSSFCILS